MSLLNHKNGEDMGVCGKGWPFSRVLWCLPAERVVGESVVVIKKLLQLHVSSDNFEMNKGLQ